MQVGFIGLGTMGSWMALNLLKSGCRLIVHDIRRDSAAAHLAAGAAWADSVGEVARAADVVFTSVPGPREFELIGLGDGGLLADMKPGTAWFDLSTNSPTVIRRASERFAAKGIDLLDAPVSGGPSGARSGKLAIYVGGPKETFERHAALLGAIGDQTMHVGEIGSGTIAKLAHNCAGFIVKGAVAEVFAFGVKAGVEPLALWHAMRQGAGGRRRTYDGLEQFLQGKYEPAGFALRLAHKDMVLARELAREMGVPTPLSDAAYADMNDALQRGWGERDGRSAMQLALERAGIEIEESETAIKKTSARG